jgi:hypothetical protein
MVANRIWTQEPKEQNAIHDFQERLRDEYEAGWHEGRRLATDGLFIFAGYAAVAGFILGVFVRGLW